MERLIIGKNGIPKRITLKDKSKPGCLNRKVREGGGFKPKRAFHSKHAAELHLAQLKNSGMQAYPCSIHGWHVGHPRGPKMLVLFETVKASAPQPTPQPIVQPHPTLWQRFWAWLISIV